MGRLDGKVAVITGTSSGIGKQTAIRFAQEGAKLAICARREAKLMETARICEEAGVDVLAMTCDIMDLEQMDAFVAAIDEKYGRVDVLVNNAAKASILIPFEDQTFKQLDMCLKSELHASWYMMQKCFPLMKEHGGSIINVGSNAVQGNWGFAAYAAAKASVMALTRVVANEWGKYGIRCNNLVPIALTDSITNKEGKTNSKLLEVMSESMIKGSPLKRISNPEDDIVPVSLFLASDDSRWITGQDIRAEGGMDIHW